MTIKSKIIEIELENNLKKKDVLEKIDAPRDMIKKVNDLINNLEQNIWVIKDPKQLVKQEFKSVRKASTPNGTKKKKKYTHLMNELSKSKRKTREAYMKNAR